MTAEQSGAGRVSRRRMLKAIGAGTAVAWSAPILTSIRTPAFAQYPACQVFNDFLPCPNPTSELCGDPGVACPLPTGCPIGGCVRLDDESCFCFSIAGCNNPVIDPNPVCQSDADCTAKTGPGSRCGPVNPSCGCSGDRACFAPCPTPAPRSLQGRQDMFVRVM